MKGNRKSTKIVEYQLICIDYRWICINYQALVLETFFCLSKRWLFLICDIILDYREALVFYRIFSTLVINFFEFLKFGSKSIEKSIENRYQSTSVTVNFTDNRDYRAVLYSMASTTWATWPDTVHGTTVQKTAAQRPDRFWMSHCFDDSC